MTYLMFGFALALSTVAAFYAIFGLVAIFAAAPIAIIILGSLLEGSKLVVASWLYRNWKKVPILLKTYFLIAVIVLMFLTSVGIFGFLSRAHIEQTAVGTESQAQIDRIDREVARQSALIERAEARFNQLQTTGLGADSNIQSQIDIEQRRIDAVYDRLQPSIEEQQRIIDSQLQIHQDELARIDQQLQTLQEHINSGDVRKAQAMVGTRADGQFGPASAAAVRSWQEAREQERRQVTSRIQSINESPAVKAARTEMQRLRMDAESQVAESNRLINRLREQLGSANASDVEEALNGQQEVIRSANAEIDTLTQQKYQLEAEVRKLEVEVGPIKYIAEIIYGDSTDANTLEKAVRIMIILLVVVFDPLAVLMLIAANWSMINSRPPSISVKPQPPTPQPIPDKSTQDTPPVEPKPEPPKDPNPSIEQPAQPATPRKKITTLIPDALGSRWIARPKTKS